MFCKMCGRNIPDGVKFCPYCGNTTAKPPKKGNAGFIITIVVLSILLCAALAVILLTKPWEKDDNDNGKNETFVNENIGNYGEALEDFEVSTETETEESDFSDLGEGIAEEAEELVEDEDFTVAVDDEVICESETEEVVEGYFEEETVEETTEAVEVYVNPVAAQFLERCENTEEWATALGEMAVTQHEINSASAEIYAKWDGILNEVYIYLRDTMSPEEFAVLKADEIEWIKVKEAAVEAEGKNWEGGSGAPMAMNGVASAYTKERCYYLISLIK